jgi:hypothetical protein
MTEEIDIESVRAMLQAWGHCINGGLPNGYGQPGLFFDEAKWKREDWCPQADEVEEALRKVRR